MESHFSFRHDVTVETIREQASKYPCIRLLDCGCGNGSLPEAIAKAGLPINRIRYFGFDQNEHHARQTRAQAQSAGYDLVDVKVRELSDLAGYSRCSFDVIVLNNILHEIPVELLPRLFEQLDSFLARPHGVLCIVDMEALPPEDAIEPWAVMWKASEIEQLLRAGNWSPQHTIHPKRVMTYKVVISPTEHVDLNGMDRFLKSALKDKKRRLLDCLIHRRETGDTGNEIFQLACAFTSVELSLFQLSRGG